MVSFVMEEFSKVFAQIWKELILMVGRNKAKEHWKKQNGGKSLPIP